MIEFPTNSSGTVSFLPAGEPDAIAVAAFDFHGSSPHHQVSMGPFMQSGKTYIATIANADSVTLSLHAASGAVLQLATAYRPADATE